MQVYIPKAELANDQPVAYGLYEDVTPLPDRNLLGTNYSVLTLPTTVLTRSAVDTLRGRTILKTDWRTQPGVVDKVINGEAYRRIIESFTEFMQRNATNDLVASNSRYGMDMTTWPQDAKDRKAEADRGWDYIKAIRLQADALSSQTLPTDPTDDSNWPTRIAPVYIPPV